MASARQLFAEHGFEGTSTKSIAAHADVPSGLLCYYFVTKEKLLETIFEDNPAMQTLRAASQAAQHDSSDQIEAALHAMYKGMLENRYKAYILTAEISSSRPIAKKLRTMRKEALAAIADILRTQAEGIRTAVELETLAQVVGSSIISAALLDQPKDVDLYVKGLATVVRAGLSSRKDRP